MAQITDQSNSFWAVILICIACIVAVICLYAPMRENVTMAVMTMASSIVTGAFGYIQGRKDEATNRAIATVVQPLPPPTTKEGE